MTALLEVEKLEVGFGATSAVRGASLAVEPGETHCLVGESGCGKSVTALAVMNLLARGARRSAERLVFQGEDLTRLSDAGMARLRGNAMAMIFQEPMTSLNPAYTIGSQMTEVLRRHKKASQRVATDRAAAHLRSEGFDPDQIVVTGNTGIDALLEVAARPETPWVRDLRTALGGRARRGVRPRDLRGRVHRGGHRRVRAQRRAGAAHRARRRADRGAGPGGPAAGQPAGADHAHAGGGLSALAAGGLIGFTSRLILMGRRQPQRRRSTVSSLSNTGGGGASNSIRSRVIG